ncbi:MAG: hypothetical protein K2O17_02520 [Bacteroidaceae bacterium]|nr:hypothetical protein [Bacteroidaceae bacterium]
MIRIALLFLLSLSQVVLSTAHAAGKDRETRKVLDATAAKLNKAGGISLHFKATTLLDKVPQDSSEGAMDIMRKKFVITTPDMLSWFDGKTQWTMMKEDEEVTLTEPTGAELQAINPYVFLEIYKQGFNYKMTKGTLSNSSKGYKIFLTADNAKLEIREIFLEIDENYIPVRVSMRQGKSQWVRITISSFTTGKRFPDSHFTFPKDKYPQVEIIDLR